MIGKCEMVSSEKNKKKRKIKIKCKYNVIRNIKLCRKEEKMKKKENKKKKSKIKNINRMLWNV